VFKTVRIRRISEEITEQIKSAIVAGKLKPGERLPPERELVKQLGVSRVSLREALKSLESTGFVEIRRGGGCSIRPLLTDKVRDPLNLMIKENLERVFDLIEVRKEIEAWSAYHGAMRATEEDILLLSRIVEETKTHLDRGEAPPNKLDQDFHMAVSQSSHNTIQSHLMFTVYDLFSEYFRFLTEKICFNRRYLEQIHHQHLEILRAIEQKNPGEARERITEHLNFVEEQLRNLLSLSPGSPSKPQ
jgi:GntR family transcriptional repressor for pyruvate dehydrogenase complex